MSESSSEPPSPARRRSPIIIDQSDEDPDAEFEDAELGILSVRAGPINQTISKDGTKGNEAEATSTLRAVFNRFHAERDPAERERMPAPPIPYNPIPLGGPLPPPPVPGDLVPMPHPEPDDLFDSLIPPPPLPNYYPPTPMNFATGGGPSLAVPPLLHHDAPQNTSSHGPDQTATGEVQPMNGTMTQTHRDITKADIGEVLRTAGSSQLGIDLNGNSPMAKFFRSLIETIQLQQVQLGWLSRPDDIQSKPIDPQAAHQSDTAESSPFTTISHVQCERLHNLFFDTPRIVAARGYDHLEGTKKLKLRAKRGKTPLQDYHVVAVQSYQCAHEEISAGSQHSVRTASNPDELDILLTSPEMRSYIAQCTAFPPADLSFYAIGLSRRDYRNMQSISMRTGDVFYFCHRHKLAELAEKGCSEPRDEPDSSVDDEMPEMLNALSPAMRMMSAKWDEECDSAQRLFEQGFVDERSVHLLFHPNTPIISTDRGEYKVSMLSEYATHDSGYTSLKVWSWVLSGQRFFREYSHVSTKSRIQGRVRITTLSAYPLQYAPEEVCQALFERGKKYWSLRSRSFKNYIGVDANGDLNSSEIRVMIDKETYHKVHSSNTPQYADNRTECEIRDSLPVQISVKSPEPTDKLTLQLMPPFIYGFNLQDKKWINIKVDNVRDIRFNRTAYNHLMLPDQTKELVRALVETQQEPALVTDVVEGKGNGLILLLHGGPGTGKTLTAESVAEIARKPLYRVTCGDIGTDPDSMEKYLNGVLMLGKTWNCVILFDEADVFLEEREINDLVRNSIVSVFLRTLEYYEGILILTSNRVGTFDEAFKSRIQVAIHYPPLSRASRGAIWRNLLELMEAADPDAADFTELRDCESEIAAADLNGRQIRNALSTARRLASFRRQPLAPEHVRQVIDIAGRFTKYLDKAHKHTDDERQRELGVRY